MEHLVPSWPAIMILAGWLSSGNGKPGGDLCGAPRPFLAHMLLTLAGWFSLGKGEPAGQGGSALGEKEPGGHISWVAQSPMVLDEAVRFPSRLLWEGRGVCMQELKGIPGEGVLLREYHHQGHCTCR